LHTKLQADLQHAFGEQQMSVAHLRRERAALTQSNEQLSTTLSVAEASRASAAKTALLNECEVTAARARTAALKQRLHRSEDTVSTNVEAIGDLAAQLQATVARRDVVEADAGVAVAAAETHARERTAQYDNLLARHTHCDDTILRLQDDAHRMRTDHSSE
jgi:hypothetical protein